jgi:hypothetical protein
MLVIQHYFSPTSTSIGMFTGAKVTYRNTEQLICTTTKINIHIFFPSPTGLSQIQSHFMINGQSDSLSWCPALSEVHDLGVDSFSFVWGPLWWEDGSVPYQLPQSHCILQVYMALFTIYTRLLWGQALNSSLQYTGCLVTWGVIGLATI